MLQLLEVLKNKKYNKYREYYGVIEYKGNKKHKVFHKYPIITNYISHAQTQNFPEVAYENN